MTRTADNLTSSHFGTIIAASIAAIAAFIIGVHWSAPALPLSAGSTSTSDIVLVPLLILQTLFLVGLLVQGRRARRGEKALRETQELMQFAARAANLRLWSWDAKRNRVWISSDVQAGTADDPPSWRLLPFDCLASVYPEDRPAFDAKVRQALAKVGAFEIEHRIVERSGGMRWVRVQASPETDESGRVTRFNGIVLDITERKAREAELEAQREMLSHSGRIGILGELSGALTHELNQPLAAILSNAQAAQHVLAAQTPDLNELRSIVTDIIGDDNRARDVIGHLHSLLKKGRGNFQAVDVNTEIKLALTIARSELVRRQIEVTLILDPELPKIYGDRVQISQVLLNLILNAADAMKTNGSGDRFLTLTSSVGEHGAAQVSVRDNGPGIPGDAVSRIFEPFYSTKAQGLGLGLSICRSIVAAHEGKLWVKNNSGVGATFFVSFPHPKRKAA